MVDCKLNKDHRVALYTQITHMDGSFHFLTNSEKFTYLIKSSDRTILTWFGKFLHKSFKDRKDVDKNHKDC